MTITVSKYIPRHPDNPVVSPPFLVVEEESDLADRIFTQTSLEHAGSHISHCPDSLSRFIKIKLRAKNVRFVDQNQDKKFWKDLLVPMALRLVQAEALKHRQPTNRSSHNNVIYPFKIRILGRDNILSADEWEKNYAVNPFWYYYRPGSAVRNEADLAHHLDNFKDLFFLSVQQYLRSKAVLLQHAVLDAQIDILLTQFILPPALLNCVSYTNTLQTPKLRKEEDSKKVVLDLELEEEHTTDEDSDIEAPLHSTTHLLQEMNLSSHLQWKPHRRKVSNVAKTTPFSRISLIHI